MDQADKKRVEQFLSKWLGSEGSERRHYQGFFLELCDALGADRPSSNDDSYCFEKDIKFYSSKKTEPTTRFADFYKEGHFLIEAKQGSDSSGKGHGKRGTKVYRDAMQKAFNQARQYAGMLAQKPPFLLTCDIGSHFELWEGFSGEYGSYGARDRINLNDLAQPKTFDRFVKIFTEPQALNPEKLRARVTREVANELAKLSRWMEGQGHDPQETASFLMRCIFTMFAEDVGLLKEDVFTKALKERWIPNPADFQPQIEELWQTMNTGGTFGFDRILKFNGSFFEEATAFALPKEQLEILYAAAAKDWSQVEPAIFGTLVERALEKKERSRLGAHYTPRSYVERLVRPVVMEPLRQEWEEIELEVQRLLTPKAGKEEITKKQQKDAEKEITDFLEKLRTIKILDPACGTGNFLYVSLDLMKGLEQEVLTRLADVAGTVQLGLEQINPSQFLGIEINPRAAAIAELVIWIGYLQWYFKRFGNAEPPEPVLQAFGNIECRDAVLAYDGKVPDVDEKTGEVRTRWGGRMMVHPVTGEEVPDSGSKAVHYRYLNAQAADWPNADYVVSNPPFIGDKRMKNVLGDDYVDSLRTSHRQVPEASDFVMFWWNIAGALLSKRKLKAFGFITTNTITQIFNRRVIDNYLDKISLSFAIPDHPWVNTADGAAVRIALTVAVPGQSDGLLSLVVNEDRNQEEYAIPRFISTRGKIYSDLRIGADIFSTSSLLANSKISHKGVTVLGKGFFLSADELTKLLSKNKKASKVIRLLYKGKDITEAPRSLKVIDLYGLTEDEVKLFYPYVYQRIKETVFPVRAVQKRKAYRENWWVFAEPRSQMRDAMNNIERYIVSVETARHRVFVWLNKTEVLPDVKLVVFASNDAYCLGVLSSTIHINWSLEAGGTLEDRPVYSKTTCFDPFPFPDPSPEQKQKIRELADRLDSHRKQAQATYPKITITRMYNILEKIRASEPLDEREREDNNKALVSTLKQIHDDLDAAVLNAYGWPQDITDEQILENLVKLNAERAEEERNGLIRWLRPEYQAPETLDQEPQQPTLTGILPKEEPIIEPVEQQKWPTKPKAQLAAIRDLLRTTPGDWTTKQIAAQFKGNITQNKLKAINENLERLEWFGLIIAQDKDGITHWQYAETAQAA